jgi:hypothetical protein
MSVTFLASTGLIDLSLIKDEDVAALDEPRREALNTFIGAVLAKGKAEVRHKAARARVQAAMADEVEKHRLHQEVNPAPTALEALRIAQASYRATHS